MRIALMFALPLVLAGAAQPGATPTRTINVQLSNFQFAPGTILLTHGQSYVFHLTNDSGGGHNFVAKDFFKVATLDSAARALAGKGTIEVPSHEAVDVHLVAPRPGHYKVKCSHFLHAGFGMTGEIIVS